MDNKLAILTIEVANSIFVLIWWAFILTGTCYLIIEDSWSKWWMLPAIFLCAAGKTRNPFVAKSALE